MITYHAVLWSSSLSPADTPYHCTLQHHNISTWASTGFKDLVSFTKSALCHQNSTSHLRTTVSSKTFGDSRVDLQFNENQCRETLSYKEIVRQNREILKHFNHTVLCCWQCLTWAGARRGGVPTPTFFSC